jgi:hypothetical protein
MHRSADDMTYQNMQKYMLVPLYDMPLDAQRWMPRPKECTRRPQQATVR